MSVRVAFAGFEVAKQCEWAQCSARKLCSGKSLESRSDAFVCTFSFLLRFASWRKKFPRWRLFFLSRQIATISLSKYLNVLIANSKMYVTTSISHRMIITSPYLSFSISSSPPVSNTTQEEKFPSNRRVLRLNSCDYFRDDPHRRKSLVEVNKPRGKLMKVIRSKLFLSFEYFWSKNKHRFVIVFPSDPYQIPHVTEENEKSVIHRQLQFRLFQSNSARNYKTFSHTIEKNFCKLRLIERFF